MKTRKQYLNQEVSHRDYYAQFVNKEVLKRVRKEIGEGRLKKSKDEHLNDIPLKLWDSLAGFSFSKRTGEIVMRPYTIEPVDIKLIKEAGEGVSASTLVCIYKEAGKQIKETL